MLLVATRFPWPGTRTGRAVMMLCTALAALMYLLPYASVYFFPRSFLPENAEALTRLPDFRAKTLVLNLLGVLVLTLHPSGMFGVHAQVLARLRESPSRSEKPELIPADVVMAYGIYFTGLLAIIHLPAHKSLKELGQSRMERLVQQSLGVGADWKQCFEEQRIASAYLGLQGSALQELQQALTVLAPFLASISSLVLGPGG